MFTNKRHSGKGKVSAILGSISFLSLCLIIFLSYKNGGELSPRLGAATLFALIYSFIGVTCAFLARAEDDRFYFLPDLGIFLNGVTILAIAVMFYHGL